MEKVSLGFLSHYSIDRKVDGTNGTTYEANTKQTAPELCKASWEGSLDRRRVEMVSFTTFDGLSGVSGTNALRPHYSRLQEATLRPVERLGLFRRTHHL